MLFCVEKKGKLDINVLILKTMNICHYETIHYYLDHPTKSRILFSNININYKNGNNKTKQNIVQFYNIVLPEYRLLMYMDIVVILVTPQPGAVWRSKGPHL